MANADEDTNSEDNGNMSASKSSSSGNSLNMSSSNTLQHRLLLHEKLHKQSKCDLETPASIIANVNIKQLLTPAAFDSLPTKYQNELIKLLPEADRITLNDDETPFAMTVNALSNEFFAKSCVEYRDRLRNGEFTLSSTNKTDTEPVVWECDGSVLREQPPRTDIPKAGEAFICTSKHPPNSKKHKILKKVLRPASTDNRTAIRPETSCNSRKPPETAATKLKKSSVEDSAARARSLLKQSKSQTHTAAKPISQSAALAQKVISKAKAVSNLNSKQKEFLAQAIMAGVKRPRIETPTVTKPVVAQPTHPQPAPPQAAPPQPSPKVSRTISSPKSNSTITNSRPVMDKPRPTKPVQSIVAPVTNKGIVSPKSNQLVVTQFRKVTENGSSGEKVTKVVPIVVRNPHGQVVTTLANCNPLLTQMIKNPKIAQTSTTAPIKIEKKRSLLPAIVKRQPGNPVIVTLRTKPNVALAKNGVNKVVTEVISKVRASSEQSILNKTNSHHQSTSRAPVIVSVNGGSNGTINSRLISTAVNIQRSKQLSEANGSNAPTLDLERSYEICKQVLGKTEGGTTIVVIGPGGKKKVISKPVRSRLMLGDSYKPASSNNTVSTSDIPVYRCKHRSGKPTLTLSGHVFLAMKMDVDGYSSKAYKRKTAFKQRHKKKLNKTGNKKSAGSPTATASSSVLSIASSTSLPAPPLPASVTMVTDTKHATEPVLSIVESLTSASGDTGSLLNACMCSKRALVICRGCGAFCHSECTSKDLCLDCLESEK